MSEDILQIDYDQMATIADQFQVQSESVEQMARLLNTHYGELKNEGWVGQAADAFFSEYETELEPAIRRLYMALEEGSLLSKKIIQVLGGAEEEAAGQFTFDGEGESTPSPGSGNSDADASDKPTTAPTELNRTVQYPGGNQSDGAIPDPIQDAASDWIPDFIEDGLDKILPDDIIPDGIQNEIGDQIDKLPFNNVAEAAIVEILRGGEVNLDSDALGLVQSDEAMQAFEERLIAEITSDPNFGKEDFSFEMQSGIEFGGQRAPGDMIDQLLDPLNPAYRDTWEVGGNELTWLLRHANVTVNADVSSTGEIVLNYKLHDVLDLRPSPGRSTEYNVITEIMGTVYHDWIGASESDVNGEWQVTYSP